MIQSNGPLPGDARIRSLEGTLRVVRESLGVIRFSLAVYRSTLENTSPVEVSARLDGWDASLMAVQRQIHAALVPSTTEAGS